MAKKNPNQLVEDPVGIPEMGGEPIPPVSVVLDYFALTSGARLELLTRTNPNLARAVQIGHIFTDHIKPSPQANAKCEYVGDRAEQLERLAISIDSGGRLDMIAALDAGGNLPGEFYDKDEDHRQYAEADD